MKIYDVSYYDKDGCIGNFKVQAECEYNAIVKAFALKFVLAVTYVKEYGKS